MISKPSTWGITPDATTPAGTRVRNITNGITGTMTTPPTEHGTLGWDAFGTEAFGNTDCFRIYDPEYYTDGTEEPAGPHADVHMARTVTHGWHVEGIGTVEYVYTHLDASVTLGGPQGFRTFPLDALVEATPAPAQAEPAMIALPPLAVANLITSLQLAHLGAGFALGRLFVQANRDGSAVIYLAADQG